MDYNEALEAINLKKTAVKEAKTALRAFRKENDINPEEEIKDEKLAKKYAKLATALEKAETELAEVTEAAKALKPKVERPVKYEYPEGMTASEKKKFRTKARATAKKAAKAEEPAAEKPVKKAKKAEEPVEDSAPEAPAKPTKKKKAVQEDED